MLIALDFLLLADELDYVLLPFGEHGDELFCFASLVDVRMKGGFIGTISGYRVCLRFVWEVRYRF